MYGLWTGAFSVHYIARCSVSLTAQRQRDYSEARAQEYSLSSGPHFHQRCVALTGFRPWSYPKSTFSGAYCIYGLKYFKR